MKAQCCLAPWIREGGGAATPLCVAFDANAVIDLCDDTTTMTMTIMRVRPDIYNQSVATRAGERYGLEKLKKKKKNDDAPDAAPSKRKKIL
jgi:hypothetical protein